MRGAALISFALLLGLTSPARAQGISRSGDNGVKLGDGRLHPFAQVESHLVYNPGRSAQTSPPAVVLLLGRGGVEYLLPSDILDVELKLAGSGKGYATKADDFNGQPSWEAEAGLQLQINKEGKVSGRVWDIFERVADQSIASAGGIYTHNANTVGVGFNYKPGGGALILDAEYSFFFDLFEDGGALGNTDALDNYRHQPKLTATWKFLPKTAVFFEGSGKFTEFPHASSSDTNILLTYLGLTGAITSKLDVLLKAGYGNTFSGSGATGGVPNSFNSVVAQAEVLWKATETTRLRVGALRVPQPVALYGFFERNGGYLAFDQAFSSHVALELRADYSYVLYGAYRVGAPANYELVSEDATRRTDHLVTGKLSLTYQITDWLGLRLQDQVEWRDTDWQQPVYVDADTGDTTAPLIPRYLYNTVLLAVDFRY